MLKNVFLLSRVPKSSFDLRFLTEPLLQALPVFIGDKTAKKKKSTCSEWDPLWAGISIDPGETAELFTATPPEEPVPHEHKSTTKQSYVWQAPKTPHISATYHL